MHRRRSATTYQELVWYTNRGNLDANWVLATTHVVEGPLDRVALQRSFSTLVNAHSVLRTAYREVDGALHQVIASADAAPLDLEYADLAPLEEPQWDAEIVRIRNALVSALDLVAGHVLRAQLARLAPDRHALVLVFHHVAADVQSLDAFMRRLFEIYADDLSGKPIRENPPFQFIDVTEAFVRWSETPARQAVAAAWRERFHDVVPVEVAGDLPRAAVDSRRDAALHGIIADPMHVPRVAIVSNDVRTAVSELARVEQTTPRTVYLAALIRLLHRETGQTDICIEAATDLRRAHPKFEHVQGMLLSWMPYRVNVAGCATLRELVRRTEQVVAEADEHVLIDDYYRLVPHTVRRVVFNYVPATASPPIVVDKLQIVPRRQPFTRWYRPWDLQVNLFETPGAPLSLWSGNENIFTLPTLVALQQSYLDLLLTETRP